MLKRKREEYFGFIEQYYHSRTDEHYKDTYRQVILHLKLPYEVLLLSQNLHKYHMIFRIVLQ